MAAVTETKLPVASQSSQVFVHYLCKISNERLTKGWGVWSYEGKLTEDKICEVGRMIASDLRRKCGITSVTVLPLSVIKMESILDVPPARQTSRTIFLSGEYNYDKGDGNSGSEYGFTTFTCDGALDEKVLADNVKEVEDKIKSKKGYEYCTFTPIHFSVIDSK